MTFLSELRPAPSRRRSPRIRALLLAAAIGLCPIAAAANGARTYPATVGDTLQISVYGQDQLSGRFQIAPDGTITYPLIGSVTVAGLSTGEIARRLGTELVKRFPTGDAVTVSVAERAPVFLVGDVGKPGQYQYRPGMIVLELVALGEGLRSPSTVQDGSQLQLLGMQQDYADTSLARFAQTVRRARVTAEISGKDFTFAVPDGTPAADRPSLQRIIDAETAVFKTRQDSLTNQVNALLAQQQSYQREIETLEANLKLQTEDVQSLQQDVGSSQSLADRGLTTQTKLRETQRALSQSKRDMLDQQARLSRANQGQLDLAQRIVDLRSARMDENANAQRDIDIEIARTDLKLRSLATTMAAVQSEQGASGPGLSTTVDYSIMRMVDGDYKEIDADERTEILPGDILRARRQLNLPGRASLSLN